MLVVKIELHSAITKKITTIGTMIIANDGNHPDYKRGNYHVKVGRKYDCGDLNKIYNNPLRSAHILDYPRLSYNVWRLVMRALTRAFPEEKINLPDYDSLEHEGLSNATQEKHI